MDFFKMKNLYVLHCYEKVQSFRLSKSNKVKRSIVKFAILYLVCFF